MAPCHRAKDTIKLLQQVMSDFTGFDLWPPNRPALNPVWIIRSGLLRSSGCMNAYNDMNRVDELKQRLIDVWPSVAECY